MTPTSLIVVADRGSLKAYRVEETPNRGPSLQMVKALDITDAHGKYEDRLTDQAGRFRSGNANDGINQGAIAERQGLETETDRRIVRDLATQIGQVVQAEKSQGWSFAAPAAIYAQILEQLPNDVRDRIVEHVRSDLVKIESAKLPNHFRSLQPL